MKQLILISMITFILFGKSKAQDVPVAESFYELSAISLQGKEVPMSDYKGKVVLIVNTASKCGFYPPICRT